MEQPIHVQADGQSAEVVPTLAPLMLALWNLDLEALHAEMEDEKQVYLYLGDQEDIELFYSFLDFEKGSDILKRAMGGPDPDCWVIITFPVDVREEKLEEGEHPFGMSFCVHFPVTDLDEVLRSLAKASVPCGDCEGCKNAPPAKPQASN